MSECESGRRSRVLEGWVGMPSGWLSKREVVVDEYLMKWLLFVVSLASWSTVMRSSLPRKHEARESGPWFMLDHDLQWRTNDTKCTLGMVVKRTISTSVFDSDVYRHDDTITIGFKTPWRRWCDGTPTNLCHCARWYQHNSNSSASRSCRYLNVGHPRFYFDLRKDWLLFESILTYDHNIRW